MERTPGVQAPDVASQLSLHPSTVTYHLRNLEARGLVARERAGRQVSFYPAGKGWCQHARRIHAHLTAAGRSALRIGLACGFLSRKQIRDRGHSRSAARWALESLQAAGIVHRVNWGVYRVDEDRIACARAALHERACQGCNPEIGARP